MPKVKNKLINLLPQDEFETSILGRILKWALSSFRVMVIITELLVMSAFLSRFWLDARNSDLNEELDIGKAQVLAYEDVELEFRNIQKKLSIVKSLYNEPKSTKIFERISSILPPDIFLNSIVVNHESFLIKATSFSESSIAQFIANLEANDNYSDITLSQISTGQDDPNLIIFTVNGKVNDGK
ncbi:MAG TPA: PilN domain-containing protein [Patescibacteria group bacterium]|nr:PilN domain-containing protein [Patescibacteria group bacterium]